MAVWTLLDPFCSVLQTVSPLLVSTNMSNNIRTGLLVKGADEFARMALDTLGLSSHVSGCLSHAVQVPVGWALPARVPGAEAGREAEPTLLLSCQAFLLPFLMPKWILHSAWGALLISAVTKLECFASLAPRTT